MKKHYLALMLFAAAAMASCEKSVVGGEATGDEATLSINLSAQASTRALADTNEGAEITYYLQVFWKGELYEDLGSNNDGQFDTRLVTGQDFTLVAWADYDAENTVDYYNTDNLSNVYINKGNYEINTLNRDAFTLFKDVNITATSDIDMVLTRQFSRINIKTLDMEYITADIYEPTNVTLIYPTIYTTFNALTGLVDEGETSEMTASEAVIDDEGAISADYLFVPADGGVVDFEVEIYNGANLIVSIPLSNIPIKANYQTNISGNLLTDEANVSVEISPDWDGDIDTPVGDDDEEEGDNTDEKEDMTYNEDEDVYEVGSAVGLQMFVDQVFSVNTGASVTLVADIDLSELSAPSQVGAAGKSLTSSSLVEWTPIGTSSKPFTGTFDGAGHKVIGLYINKSDEKYQGLFGYINGATIKNVTVEGEITAGSNSGGVVGYMKGTGALVSNCVSYVNMNSASSYLGGIVGNCLVGKITDCTNYGKVEGTANSYTGGVVGYLTTGTEISDCSNYGEVSAVSQVGGVVGCAQGSISNCHNYGDVTGSKLYIGGVAGYCGRINGSSYIFVNSCSNSGKVTNTNTTTSASTYSAGGIAGMLSGQTILANCINTGEVTATYHRNSVGGLVGCIGWQITILNSMNIGKIGGGSGNTYTGGLVGYSEADAEGETNSFINCYNSSSVTGETKNIGAVFGYDYADNSVTFEHCYWDNTIEGNPSSALGANVHCDSTALMTISTTDIQSQNFVDTLNANVEDFTYANSYYASDLEIPEITPLTWVLDATTGYPAFNY